MISSSEQGTPVSYRVGVIFFLLAVAVHAVREAASIHGPGATVLIGVELALGIAAVASFFRWAVLREKDKQKPGT